MFYVVWTPTGYQITELEQDHSFCAESRSACIQWIENHSADFDHLYDEEDDYDYGFSDLQ